MAGSDASIVLGALPVGLQPWKPAGTRPALAWSNRDGDRVVVSFEDLTALAESEPLSAAIVAGLHEFVVVLADLSADKNAARDAADRDAHKGSGPS